MRQHHSYLLIYLAVSPLSYLVFFTQTNVFISITGLLMILVIATCVIIQIADLVYWMIGNKIRRPFFPLLILMAIFSGMFIAEQHHRKQSNNNRQLANSIIVRIQQYKTKHEQAPEKLSLLAIEHPESHYGFDVYQMQYTRVQEKEEAMRFILSYENHYDQMIYVYDSREQQWTSRPMELRA